LGLGLTGQGAASIDCTPTSDALRRSAAALLALADAVDAQAVEV
jgi:hypothetical protein